MRCVACNAILEAWESSWDKKLKSFGDTCGECLGISAEAAFDLQLVDNSDKKIKFNSRSIKK